MTGSIYLRQGDKGLLELNEAAYDSEDLLQKLLEDYPKLLAGEQMNSEAPRRWLLVRREMPVPGEEGGSSRWSLDHLFLDQEGIPTLIEVKRSSDTRLRREVVGQMLDYAANAVVYWPLERVQAEFVRACEQRGESPNETLGAFLEAAEAEPFWDSVKTNLQAGRIRMVFVADVIPTELRRVVEFLNLQMNPAEVLALEVKQYVGQGVQTLVPRVVGQTVAAQQQRSSTGTGVRSSRSWDEQCFLEALREGGREREVVVARRLLGWANKHDLRIRWGKGVGTGSFFPMYDDKQGQHFTFSVWTPGSVEVQFQLMQNRVPYDDEAKRLELLEALNSISGIDLSSAKLKGRPSLSLTALADEAAADRFLGIFDAYLADIKAAEGSST